MTRFLSESLQAPEPYFRIGLRRLESANGHPNNDIRLSADVSRTAKAKLIELGLDPNDTTPAELYQALQERMAIDDNRLIKVLRTQSAIHVTAEGEVVSGMVHVIKSLPSASRCYALKGSSLKSIIKKAPPKKTLKRLGYRSFDSMLKHESPVLVLAAAWLSESESWRARLLDLYKHLKPSDFETRPVQILRPESKRWQKLAQEVVDQKRHNLLCLKEAGALIFMPLPKDLPAGAVTASFSLALHELNEIRASSSFLKLSQVRADFGSMVKLVATEEPSLKSQLLDKPVPWHLIQRYYGRLGSKAEAFEPHLEQTDMDWEPVEETLSTIEPGFKFWHSTAHLGVLHNSRPVSFNIVDVALNLCNHLPFEQRVAHYFQRSLWHELMLSYLSHQPVEQTVLAELQPQLAPEYALNEAN